MKAVILIISLMIVSVQRGVTVPTVCSDCPANNGNKTCDQLLNLVRTNCLCSLCVTRCNVRNSSCNAGEECIEVPSDFSAKVKVAKCVPFSGCKNMTCSSNCPVSDYFYDMNGCNTCLCEDPCAELQCSNGCQMWTTSTFIEPTFECSPPSPTETPLTTPQE